MTFAVFIHRSDSIYDDDPAERYQFPPQYLGRVKSCVGDWIVYLEPSKVANTRGYFAVARVQEVIADPKAPGMYLALIEDGTYLDFANHVPFRGPDGLMELGVLNEEGRISGRAQSAVRPLSHADFHRIVLAGLGEVGELLPRSGEPAPLSEKPYQVDDPGVPFEYEQDRERIIQLTSRPVRDRVFRRIVLSAYDERCAVTGLKLINGGGRAEVEAAHIRPVEHNGPDTVRNGIALSGTVHWMFDRGLISLSDDLDIMVSRQVNDPDRLNGLINPTRRALAPERAALRPHPHFLAWHREHCFKQ